MDTTSVKIRRIYDTPSSADGLRVLVDRLWPRGVSKNTAHLDEWNKDIAPSSELRRWYGHKPERYREFANRYRAELADKEHAEAVDHLRTLAEKGPLTLLTATKDVEHSHVPVILRALEQQAAHR